MTLRTLRPVVGRENGKMNIQRLAPNTTQFVRPHFSRLVHIWISGAEIATWIDYKNIGYHYHYRMKMIFPVVAQQAIVS